MNDKNGDKGSLDDIARRGARFAEFQRTADEEVRDTMSPVDALRALGERATLADCRKAFPALAEVDDEVLRAVARSITNGTRC